MRTEVIEKHTKKFSIFTVASLAIVALLIGTLFLYRKEAGYFLGHTDVLLLPGVALFLDRDNILAEHIGNYYFNEFDNGAHDLDKAEEYFIKALEIDPQSPVSWFQLARIDFLRGNFQSALYKINKQIELHGDEMKNAYYIRGLIHGFDGQLGKAEQDFLKFLSFEAESRGWAVHNDLAWIYFRQGNYERAEHFANQGLLYNPGNAWLLIMRGVSLLNLGEKQEAKKVLEEALAAVEQLTEEDWQGAYPGNDPRVASQGLREMREVVEFNLGLVTVGK
jgi:tetratricopeptide (TPR) repeat protein